MTAAEAGADYIALGPIWRDQALGDGQVAEPELFAWWAEMIETPVVAEGGLTPERVAPLAAHLDFAAPCRSVWTHPDDPDAGVRAYMAALTKTN
jgi:thiamine-phosphate pyrophosphorylase